MGTKIDFGNDVRQLKYEVLKGVAKLAYNDMLEEGKDDLPYQIIPGKEAKFRCCVYKEREILRQRIRAATGKTSQDGVVVVLADACEGCPINRYTVTENCQRCVAKKCVTECPFGAITITGKGAYIDPDKCKECGRCVKACPYNAISDTLRPCLRSCPVNAISIDENKHAEIKYDRCISCGACTNDCPFGAITDVSSIVDVIDNIKGKRPVYAIFAPAIEGQFGDANIAQISQGLKELGFADSVEVALGADAVAQHEAQELKDAIENDGKLTTSCCPAFYNMVEKHFPRVLNNVSHTASPMAVTARYIRDKVPNGVVVFIGPCIAKKQEARTVPDSADYVLSFEELSAMFEARDIDVSSFDPQSADSNDASKFGKGFALSGGVVGAVVRVLEEENYNKPFSYIKCDGARECKKALQMLGAGRLNETFVEGMACENGCIAGPVGILPLRQTMNNRKKLMAQADDRSIDENLQTHDFSKINLIRK